MDSQPSDSEPADLIQRQFSIRAVLITTTLTAVIYGCLNRFGFLAHVAVWVAFLTAGPIARFVIGVRRLKEANLIVNAVQAGALGGAAGFLVAYVLLLPTFYQQPIAEICAEGLLGSVGAFTIGGILGFFFGLLRLLVRAVRGK